MVRKKFPTFEMVKQSYIQVAEFKKGLLFNLLYTVFATLGMLAIVWSIFPNVTFEMWEALAQGQSVDFDLEQNAAGDFSPGLVLLFLAVIFLSYAWLFNLWARYGALGLEGAFFNNPLDGLKAASVTLLKMFLIIILLGIVTIVTSLILAGLGLVSIDPGVAQDQSLISLLWTNLLFIAVISGAYSVFSSNLTQTALGHDKEEVGPDHVLEFAVVLFLAEAVVLVPLSILQVILPFGLIIVLQVIVGIWIMAVIPLAHGLRYDWQRQTFVGETAADQFGILKETNDESNTNEH